MGAVLIPDHLAVEVLAATVLIIRCMNAVELASKLTFVAANTILRSEASILASLVAVIA